MFLTFPPFSAYTRVYTCEIFFPEILAIGKTLLLESAKFWKILFYLWEIFVAKNLPKVAKWTSSGTYDLAERNGQGLDGVSFSQYEASNEGILFADVYVASTMFVVAAIAREVSEVTIADAP